MIDLNDSDYRSLFGRCQNPKIIINSYSQEQVLTSCGHCPNCIAIKSQKQSLMCNVHATLYKYCYFVTLTYAQKYIPKIRLVKSVHPIDDASIKFIEKDSELYNLVVNCPRLADIHGTSLGCASLTSDYMEMLLAKAELNGHLSFSYLPDVQKFLKRLRYYLNKTKANDFTYYAVSEYGPSTFRTHYHLLLFSNSDRFSQDIHRCIYKAWKYGRIDVQLADSKCSSYLTDYVNSFTYLPSMYQNKPFKPFCVHSSYFASLLPVLDKTALFNDPYQYITTTLYELHGRYVSLPLFRSTFNKLLPKCIGFRKKTIHQLYYDYTAYSRCNSQLNAHYSPSELAELFSDITSPFICDDKFQPFRAYIKDYLCRGDYELYSDPDRLKELLYRYFKCSYDFTRYLCDFKPELYWIRVKMIRRYYDQLEENRLLHFYDLMSSYSSDYSTDVSSFYYYNKLKSSVYDTLSPYADYESSLKSNPYFKQSLTYYSNLCAQMVKHKELNDKNRIFF